MFKVAPFFQITTLVLVFHSFLSSVFAEEEIRFKVAVGSEIVSYTQDLVRISDVVYSQYPYLYDGVQSDEAFYLRLYARWPDARLVMAFDHDQAIGYAVGLPMKDVPIGHEPLLANGYAVNSLFFLGEVAVLEPYRKRQIGKKMVHQIERSAKDEIGCKAICLVQIDEAPISTPKPENYSPCDGFWHKLGYEPHRHLNFNIDWKHVGEAQESHHTLFYWTKQL